MPAAYRRADLVGARMVLRSEQRPYDREPLGCDGNPAPATPCDEFAQPLNGVPLTPPSIHKPEFPHKRLLAGYQSSDATDNRGGEKKMTTGRLYNRQAQSIPALTCN